MSNNENTFNSSVSEDGDLAGSCQIGLNDSGTCEASDTPLTQWRSPTVRALELIGFTYFIRVGASIKIGAATNFKRRLEALQVAHVKPLEVLLVVPAAMADEYAVHQLFAHLRTRGEWFRADRELLNFIDGLNAELEAQKTGVSELAPPPLSPREAAVRDLHSRLHKLPRAARQFTYNLIDLFKNDVMARMPMGDHALQRPEVFFRRQVEGLERAMAAHARSAQ